MAKNLPSRPNLEHLRRQAKALLAALAAGDADALNTFQQFLPAARKMNMQKARAAGFRLADAQSAVARQSGFDAWPKLARHVEQLRALEGTWLFERLEVDGTIIPPAGLQASRLLIDGDRFRTESPEAVYEGIFNIDVEAEPHQIDIEFVEGPEAGHSNYGLFRIDGDQLELCLDMSGKGRPTAFAAAPGSRFALETLRRSSNARPAAVTGGKRGAGAAAPGPAPAGDAGKFVFVPSQTLERLEGEWSAQEIVRDGQALPRFLLKTARRSATKNEIRIVVAGTLMIHALVRINESAQPIEVDYCSLQSHCLGIIQHGILEWRGSDACFCMAPPGDPRPADFECPAGSGRTLSVWRALRGE